MNLFLKIAVIALSLSGSVLQSYGQSDLSTRQKMKEKTQVGDQYPDFILQNDSLTVSKNDLSGKVIYLNFWFTSCSPCMAEMPQINELYERFRSDTNFIFISVTTDKKRRIEETRQRFGITYPVFSISHEEAQRLNPVGFYPANIFVGKDGKIKHYETGGQISNWLVSRHFKKKLYKIVEKQLKQ